MEKYKLNIKSRRSKEHWEITIEKKVAEVVEEEVAEEEVAVETETEEVSNDNTWEIVVEPFKTTIKILQPTPVGARRIADKLNQLPEVKGSTQWSPDQNGTIISIIGKIEKTDVEEIVQPLVVKIMVEFSGDEK